MQSGQLKKALVVLSVTLVAVGSAAMAGEPYRETVDLSYPMSATGRVSLDNINGDVKVEVWDQEEVRIEAVKQARTTELLDELQVVVDAAPDAVRIETEYPRRSSNGRLRVDYTLTIPRQATVASFDLVNGSIELVGVEGGAHAESVNGKITARELGGELNLSTVNGGIEVYDDFLAASDDMEIESVNGRITVHLSGSVGAEIRAETVNGRLSNDFGVEVHKHKYVGADMNGTIGGGGARIDMSTVNGKISVVGY